MPAEEECEPVIRTGPRIGKEEIQDKKKERARVPVTHANANNLVISWKSKKCRVISTSNLLILLLNYIFFHLQEIETYSRQCKKGMGEVILRNVWTQLKTRISKLSIVRVSLSRAVWSLLSSESLCSFLLTTDQLSLPTQKIPMSPSALLARVSLSNFSLDSLC